MKLRNRLVLAALSLGIVAALTAPAGATFPFPFPGGSSNPYDYTQLHINHGDCPPGPNSDLPKGFNCKTDFKLSNYRPQPGDLAYDPSVENNPQELWGVEGPGTNKAWEVTTGRPDTIISVLDSGILWNTPELANKIHLNMGELPVPCAAQPCSTQYGTTLQQYDVNHDGVLNVQDYANDPRVTDANGNGILDPEDLIKAFSDGIDHDHNGYVNDIAGWDFYERDNNPYDDVQYGHGTGEARDSAAEIERRTTQCPNCMLMPLRVGDSFVADANAFAQAAIYATDNGTSVIQEALGTLNDTGFGQTAVDYAYRHGVLVVASAADESAGHHNFPAAYNHTMVVNSVTPTQQSGVPYSRPATYLALNGCTNFGGYAWLSVESVSCSSDATGQSAGMAGLLYSAARNAVEKGVIRPAQDGSGRPLSAEEAKQLLRIAADDINFSTPRCGTSPDGAPGCGPPNNFATTIPASQRFVTTAGWDQISGWGRLNIDRAVRLVAAGTIPPQADITYPRWWQPLGTTGRVPVVGSVGAPRTGPYTYQVQFAPGVQPPRWPSSDTWTTVGTGGGTSPRTGVLGMLDMAQVRHAIDTAPAVYTPADDPTSRDLPEQNSFRIRVVVCAPGPCPADEPTLDTSPNVAIEQRQAFSFSDPTTVPGFPRYFGADGAGSPAFANVTSEGDSKGQQIVFGDGNGFVHVLQSNGREAPGFPVHTDPLPLPTTGSNAYTLRQVPATVYSPILLGSPAVADLNGDGRPEIAVAAADGKLYVWDNHGRRVPGFPVGGNPAYSSNDVRDPLNTQYWSFTSQPAVGKLDTQHPGLDLVVGSNDMHVYAFHADGTPVPGWPVFLGDPSKIKTVDPVTHKVTYTDNSALRGRKIITTPTIGDAFHDGHLEVAVNVNEQYLEDPNWSVARDPGLKTLAEALGASSLEHPGNTRTYLLYQDGTLHAQHDGSNTTPNPDDQAYVKGWPVKIGLLTTELLPDVGEGSNGSPVMADVNGDGKLEIATASIAGPVYLLNGNGTDYYSCCPDGYAAMNTSEFKNPQATDGPSLPSLGGAVFGRLASNLPLSVAMGSSGLRRLLDVALPEQQLGAEDHLGVWDTTTGSYMPGFPAQMNDLMFFNTPAIVDVKGDGNAEVLQGSAMYDLRGYGLGGAVPTGFPKFTGGWMVDTPAAGTFSVAGKIDVAVITREGYLYVWKTDGAACQTAQWPKFQHDLWNTGNYNSTAPTGLGCNTAGGKTGRG